MDATVNQLWAGLLQATGRALVPEKSFWYYIHNTWSQGRWQYVPNPNSHDMHVPDDNNASIQILELPPSEAWRTLGVWLAPNENNTDKFQHLLDVAHSWNTLMSAAKVTHAAAKFSLRQVILRKLEYPLVATTFTQTECQSIMSPILTAGLPVAGLI